MRTFARITGLILILVVLAGTAVAYTPVPIPAPPPVPVPPPIAVPPPLPGGLPTDLPGQSPSSQPQPQQQSKGDTLDDWMIDQVDAPLRALKPMFASTVLRTPSLLAPTEAWVLKGWGSLFLFGLLLLIGAWMNHSRHLMKGTDLLRRKNPLTRLGIPAICLVAMLLVPWTWELVSQTQMWLWGKDGLDRSNPNAVIAVIFPGDPGIDIVPPDDEHEPISTPQCGSDWSSWVPTTESKPCHVPGKPHEIRYPSCGLWTAFNFRPPTDIGAWEGTPCRDMFNQYNVVYPYCPAIPGSPCQEMMFKGKTKYPKCGEHLPGMPCSDDDDPYTTAAGRPDPVHVPGREPGSVAPVVASLGTWVGVGSGLAMLVLGLLGFLIYLAGRILIIISPIYLGITAFSDRPEPMLGWLNLALRTNLMLSLFNLAWLLMRSLPTWMKWTGVDNVVFVVLVLPAVLAVIWVAWMRPLLKVVGDPLMLGGGAVMQGVGQRTSSLGKLVTLAGAVTGNPALVARGAQMTAWGAGASAAGQKLTEATKEGGTIGAVEHMMGDRIKALSTSPATTGSPDTQGQCWQDGSQFVTVERGVPTWHPSQPPGTRLAGKWKDEA